MSEFYIDPDAPVQPDQFAVEFGKLLEIYRELNPRKVLEIGVREGGTLYQWMKHTQPGALIVAIDLPHAGWGSKAGPDVEAWSAWAEKFGHELIPILGDSHRPEVISEAQKHEPYDFVFIDGDHTYAGAEADWNSYDGNVMVFHDILPDASDEHIKVYELWREIRCGKQELISEENQQSRGIGLIYV